MCIIFLYVYIIFNLQSGKVQPQLVSSQNGYLGCFTDQIENRLLESSRQTNNVTLVPEICNDLCLQRGFPFSGTESGYICYCGFQYPSIISRASEAECNAPCAGDSSKSCGGTLRLSAYETGAPKDGSGPASVYLGCYKDNDKADYFERNNRLLKGYYKVYNESLTPSLCDEICLKKGFLYFGMTLGNVCYCGDQRAPEQSRAKEENCYLYCTGEPSKRCGGGWQFSIYATGIPDMPAAGKYLTCAEFTSTSNLNPEYKVMLPLTNSPRRCLNICGQKGYKYSGVRNGRECYCSNGLPPENLKADDETCEDVRCPGDHIEYCGAAEKLRIYNTYATDPIDIRREECELSVTTLNGERKCKGKIIFSSNSVDDWFRTVKIAAEPDYEFVSYSASSTNAFQKNKRIHIHPTTLNSSFVSHGTLNLENCTGKKNTEECIKTAMAYNILPPIQSARLTTQDKFSFRYGVVQIRAKLPVGDWLIPEIWLVPKDEAYGPGYASGRIQIAMARGNKNLYYNNETIGNNLLEGGILMGSGATVKERKFKKRQQHGWSSAYHNFTITWRPDNILFHVDNKLSMTLLRNDGDTVKKVTGVTDTNIWDKGTKLAPFDKEFYISIGLSAGGIREFPDGCTISNDVPKECSNTGAKFFLIIGAPVGGIPEIPNGCINNNVSKPWSNTGAKALLNFWQAKDVWSKTWSDEESAFKIEQVTVTAL